MNKIVEALWNYESYEDLNISKKIVEIVKDWENTNQCFEFKYIVEEFNGFVFVIHNNTFDNEVIVEAWSNYCQRIISILKDLGFDKNTQKYEDLVSFWHQSLDELENECFL